MKLDFLLYWAMMAFSIYNTIVLFWLGLTVILNAEKRNGGIWLATGGLLLGGVFFATHTAMLDYTVDDLVAGARFWWHLFFAPIILLPHAWYLLMLWYAGFWDDPRSELHQRHRTGLLLTTLLVVVLLVLLLKANPFSVEDGNTLALVRRSARLFPFVAVLYPLYLLACTAFSLNALHRPAPSGRMMGDLARRRARPWLLAASLVQLLVSILILAAFGWLMLAVKFWSVGRIVNDGAFWMDWLDLTLTVLLALTITLVGKAIVSYEIFTGKTLPRRGFLRQWRGVVTVAGLFSILAAWCIGYELRSIYALLLVVILAAVTFALLSWRFFRERELAVAQLRPFAASQHLYERVLAAREDQTQSHAPRQEAESTFAALCKGVLETRAARLVPLGALSPLAGASLCFPDENAAPVLPANFAERIEARENELAFSINDSSTSNAPADGPMDNGAAWAIPLRSNRGLIGVLLLGEKKSGGLYAEEEIVLARESGERLLDALAGAALASRLMELQRRRLSETQLADHRARRALHDEILPRLHAAMLMLNGDEDARREAQKTLAETHGEISSLLRAMPSAIAPPIKELGLFGALHRAIEDEFARVFDAIHWNIEPQAEDAARVLAPLVAETIFHAAREAARNAARHGRKENQQDSRTNDAPTLQLFISATAREGLQIIIEDNGPGIGASPSAGEPERRESSTMGAGSGQGLTLHSTMMAVVGGTLALESSVPRGVRVILSLPTEASRG